MNDLFVIMQISESRKQLNYYLPNIFFLNFLLLLSLVLNEIRKRLPFMKFHHYIHIPIFHEWSVVSDDIWMIKIFENLNFLWYFILLRSSFFSTELWIWIIILMWRICIIIIHILDVYLLYGILITSLFCNINLTKCSFSSNVKYFVPVDDLLSFSFS